MRITTLLALVLALPLNAHAGGTDVFSGIYSMIDPRTGTEMDVFKISKSIDDYVVLTSYDNSWSGPDWGNVGTPAAKDVLPGPFPQDARVRTLWLEDKGAIYQMPPGAFSRAGRSDTGYLAHMLQLGSPQLKRRPLLAGHPERGERGLSTYQPRGNEQKVTVSTLNYSANPVQIGVSDPANKDNAVDTDPLNPYMRSVRSCCYYLPQQWNASLHVNIEYRSLPDGRARTETLAVPEYNTPHALWVTVSTTGKVALGEPGGEQGMPAPPPAERTAIRAALIKRQKENVADLNRQLDNMPAEARRAFRDDLTALKHTLRFTEALAACSKSAQECESDATAEARQIR